MSKAETILETRITLSIILETRITVYCNIVQTHLKGSKHILIPYTLQDYIKLLLKSSTLFSYPQLEDNYMSSIKSSNSTFHRNP
jgi:hypothetical protein